MFDSAHVMGNWMQLFQLDVAYYIAMYITKLRFPMLTKTTGMIIYGGFLRCIIIVQCTVYNMRWISNALQPML